MTAPDRSRRSAAIRFAFALLLAVLCAAPTPGDIGSCGQQPQPLDAGLFFAEKAATDCEKCAECGFVSEHCTRACSSDLLQTAFPEGCEPLVHDGEVCLRVLRATGCSAYEEYVRDAGRQAPSECLFCPWESAP
ncbi:MAG TPA: hypothetical protein VGK73_07890 [Polyangiaceae bacterium]